MSEKKRRFQSLDINNAYERVEEVIKIGIETNWKYLWVGLIVLRPLIFFPVVFLLLLAFYLLEKEKHEKSVLSRKAIFLSLVAVAIGVSVRLIWLLIVWVGWLLLF